MKDHMNKKLSDWKIYDSAVDESTSTDDEDCHHHGNEVHKEEYVQQNNILHIC